MAKMFIHTDESAGDLDYFRGMMIKTSNQYSYDSCQQQVFGTGYIQSCCAHKAPGYKLSTNHHLFTNWDPRVYFSKKNFSFFGI